MGGFSLNDTLRAGASWVHDRTTDAQRVAADVAKRSQPVIDNTVAATRRAVIAAQPVVDRTVASARRTVAVATPIVQRNLAVAGAQVQRTTQDVIAATPGVIDQACKAGAQFNDACIRPGVDAAFTEMNRRIASLAQPRRQSPVTTISAPNTVIAADTPVRAARFDSVAPTMMRKANSFGKEYGLQANDVRELGVVATAMAVSNPNMDIKDVVAVAASQNGLSAGFSARVRAAIAADPNKAIAALAQAPGESPSSAGAAHLAELQQKTRGWQNNVDAARAATTRAIANDPSLADGSDPDAGYDADGMASALTELTTRTKAKDDPKVDPNELAANALRQTQKRNDFEVEASDAARKQAKKGDDRRADAENRLDKEELLTGTLHDRLNATV